MRHRFWRYRFKAERPSIRFVRQAPFAGCTLIDIGANKGVYSFYMSRCAGPGGTVIAFEPQPELLPHLQAVKATFGLDNLTIVNMGLSATPGTLTMRRAKAGSGMAGFHHQADPALETLDVPVTTLDDFLEQRRPGTGRVRFIKCDVEGHELEVFRGARKMLAGHAPALLFECTDHEARRGELFDYLAGLGYDGCFFYVEPKDHRSVIFSGRGRYVHYSRFAELPYPRPEVGHRNYIFLAPADPLRERVGPALP